MERIKGNMKIIINQIYSITREADENIRAEIEIQDNSNIAIAKLTGDRNLLFEIRLTNDNYIETIEKRLSDLNLGFDYKSVIEII